MALTLKILSAGSFPATADYLYPPSGNLIAGKTALIRNIILVNKHATETATVNVMIQRQGATGPTADIHISPFNMKIAPGQAVVLDDELTLNLATGPDRVKATASLPTGPLADVQYVINGLERDI